MKEKMLDEIIRKFGFEHKWTIQFARMCEKYGEAACKQRYEILMKK